MRYPAMPRFFFHLQDDETICDREGQFFLDVEEARQAAIRSARDMLAEEVRRGELNLVDRILIADENGNAVLVVPFADAVRLRLPSRPAMLQPE